MQAYEFYATPENGVIPIPAQYRNRVTKNVRVILFESNPYKFDKEELNTRKKSDLLLPPVYNTKSWKFSREEANER